ncbi:MAG TPA: CDP-alcohol phosphatidyltransferase family protein [Rugosimonospora sp.]
MRRSGSLARQVLTVRVGRRRRGLGTSGTPLGAGVVTLPAGPDAGLETLPGHLAAEPLARIIAPAVPTLPAPVAPIADGVIIGGVTTGGVTAGGIAAAGVAGAGIAGAGIAGAARDAGPCGPIPLLPGEPTLARRIRFAAVNACTIGSLVLGMSAIFLSMHSGVRWAALCLVGCVTFDGLDGALARRLGVASPFGAQMDSLADMCSFGIAAPVVVYASVHNTARTGLVAAACVLVAACSAIRLARFNVSPKDGRFFCGVPTTMAAAVLGLAVLIGLRPSGTVAVAAIAVLALAMVSGFPYAKLARIVKLPAWLWLAPVVGAFLDYRITFAALVALYLASGPLLWLRQRGGAPAR